MSHRVMAYGVVALAVGAAAALLGGLVMLVTGDSATAGLGLMVAGLLGFGAAIHLSGRYPLKTDMSRDVRQVQWADTIALMSFMGLLVSPLAGGVLWTIASGGTVEARWPLVQLALFAVIVVAQLGSAFRRSVVGDELMRFYVSSALTWGFGAAILGLVGLALAAVAGAQAVVSDVPVALAATLFVAGQRLWWQVRRADG